VEVGYKYVGGERTDQVVIRVHVAHKRDDVPDAERIPETIEGVPTDVLESRFEEIADGGNYRPLCGGIDVGRNWSGADQGTLGAIVVDNKTHARMALSAHHVFFDPAEVTDYDITKDKALGASQPAGMDHIGFVQRAKYNKDVDAAVVELIPEADSVARVMDLVVTGIRDGGPPDHRGDELGARVAKRGRSTEWTEGRIEAVTGTFARQGGGVIQGAFSISSTGKPFCAPGDSGSVIVTKGGQVMGLLVIMSGRDSGVLGIAIPISTVLETMGVSMAYEGIGGFDLGDQADLGFAFDPNGTGRLDHLLFYRPGSGIAALIAHDKKDFPAIYRSNKDGSKTGTGIGDFPLTGGRDRAFAMEFSPDPTWPDTSRTCIVFYRPGEDVFVIMGTSAGGREFEHLFPSVLDSYMYTSEGGVGGYHLTSPLDRAFALDYRGTDFEKGRATTKGKLDAIVLYRPGSNRFWILSRDARGGFTRVYPDPTHSPAPDQGIGGYRLDSENDQAFAFDYDSTGHADHIVLYRPGSGRFWILGKAYDEANETYSYERVYPDPLNDPRPRPGEFPFVNPPDKGLGGYPLTDPRDRAFPFDFDGTGHADHIALYRPGAGIFWILAHRTDARGRPIFTRVFPDPDEAVPAADGLGPGQYNLAHKGDKAFAFDYTSSGRLDHLVLYRPGMKTCWIARRKKSADGKLIIPPVFESVYEAWGTKGGYPGR